MTAPARQPVREHRALDPGAHDPEELPEQLVAAAAHLGADQRLECDVVVDDPMPGVERQRRDRRMIDRAGKQLRLSCAHRSPPNGT